MAQLGRTILFVVDHGMVPVGGLVLDTVRSAGCACGKIGTRAGPGAVTFKIIRASVNILRADGGSVGKHSVGFTTYV